jgi:hypothetical protein
MPGGVCAVLDYEVDVMAEYVAEMAMRIVMPNSSVTAAFRKFVSQILSSTRLPSTTILLGMNYLAKRVNTLNAVATTPFKPNEGLVWRMLTVSLLLGSKFLDDNTFQNRSWADVSGIAVQELNTMESEWLLSMSWCLYVDLDRSGDYTAWLSNWKDWASNKKQEQIAARHQSQVARERLTPIVTSLRGDARPHVHHPLAYEGWTPEEISDFEQLQLARSKSYRPRENSWHGAQFQNTWPADPLTPPDSGYGTPEYLNSAASLNSRYNEWFGSAVTAGYANNRAYHPGNMSHQSRNSYGGNPFRQPFYPGHYGGMGHWDNNAGECTCQSCMANLHKPGHYFHHNPYGQPVMG